MRMSQAKRKTRCSGGGHRSDVVSLPFSVGRPLYMCKGRKKRGQNRCSFRASRVRGNGPCDNPDEQVGGYPWKKLEDAP